MKQVLIILSAVMAALPAAARAQEYAGARIQVAIVKAPGSADGPVAMETGGLNEMLLEMNCNIAKVSGAELTPDEDRQYGEWNRTALYNGRLTGVIAENRKNRFFTIGLLGNCSYLLGMLGGLQHQQPSASEQVYHLAGNVPLRVGLVWVDAHADFNTPETTLSGMLGGMPVAIAAGMCLTRHRRISGLDPALPTKYIVMAGVRDVDPLEQFLLDRSFVEVITTDEIRSRSNRVNDQMERLSRLTDVIYVHIDMDVLDPAEVRGHSLTVPRGPTSEEPAAWLEMVFKHEKAAAIGIASLPTGERDPDKISLNAAYRLIAGAIRGVQARR